MPAIISAKPRKEDYASLDFETRAVRNLRSVGAYKYAECSHFQPMCLGWAINDDEVRVWRWGDPFPSALERHIARGGKLHAWHALFERVAWRRGMAKYIQPERGQWRCTMVRALSCGLPGKLELAAAAMRIPERKDVDGAKAMMKLSKPRKVLPDGKPIWWEDEALFQRMMKYCAQDVVTERAIGYKLPYLRASEEAQYRYDQLVADRGILLDQELCEAAIQVAFDRKNEVTAQCRRISGFTPTQVAELRGWVNRELASSPGIPEMETFKKDTVEKYLKRKDLPKNVRIVLQARQEAGRGSTSKFETALDCVCEDGTLKGMRQFYGAHTGRWAGRNVQMDNMARPTMKNIDDIVGLVKTGDAQLIESVYDAVMEPLFNTVRSMVVAEEDQLLYVGDYKSIESRLLAETSGQTSTLIKWKLSDEGRGPDVYVSNADNMFQVGLKEAAKKEYRSWGKIAELSLGYEAGQGSLLNKAEESGAKYRDIYPVMHKNASQDIREKVQFLWNKMGSGHEKDWKAARYVVENWRKNNPMSVKLWRQLTKASVKAVSNPGSRVRYRDITYWFDKETQILFCDTNSGFEPLKYPFAHTVVGKDFKGNDRLELRAFYQDTKRGFIRYHPYGGLMTENIVQKRARDTMAGNFKYVERAGFKLRHTVHDELIATAKKSLGLTVEQFVKAATVRPPWTSKDFPLALEAWCGPRYRKEGD